jgi:hypothetical protein
MTTLVSITMVDTLSAVDETNGTGLWIAAMTSAPAMRLALVDVFSIFRPHSAQLKPDASYRRILVTA